MNLINKNSHELIAGDVVVTYGALIQLEEVYCLIWEKNKENACVVAVGKCLNKDSEECQIPNYYFDGENNDKWNCQGNKLRNWSVIVH
jgi:hypothetical protein